ncbi:TetR/AcrR family transcriptional regulator C-terminal domain-containing protein [Microbacterium fluvii]|uniref:TetR/AcrR family transcriptional regulator C-terminal domain-containing protein n=1 Tax=Microbacterium fluvii TaxID=415215 RepID=A0ABW2HGT7_9MICO|nr:TetR/AcrR family transcriptional regulator C-terminal domain-containing protein [Microbacterium fluvii]MCU4673991.1 TetR/AcrR family transcriptional regulator C-terminal domain-containing protein [Microbacterium fluvii]
MPKGITRELIVAAALDVLDDGGIDAVTVRAVATRLGVKAPALYWHVAGKQELLDEMGTEIQRRVQAVVTVEHAQDWADGLAGYARALRAEYLRHRDGARTFSGTRLTDPAILRAQEPWLEQWTAQGMALADVLDAAETVTAFVVGAVIEEQERAQSAASDPTRYAVEARDAALEGAPLVVEAGHDRGSADERFERQLRIVLAGVRAVAAD